jgi:hypothetical protein
MVFVYQFLIFIFYCTCILGSQNSSENSFPHKKVRYNDEYEMLQVKINRLEEKCPKIYKYWTRPLVIGMIDHYAQSHKIMPYKILIDLIKQNRILIQEMKQFESKSDLDKFHFLYTKKDKIHKQVETFYDSSSYMAWPYIAKIHKMKNIQSVWTVR